MISRTFGAGVVGDYLPRPAGTKSVPLARANFSRPSAYFLTFGSLCHLLNLNNIFLKKCRSLKHASAEGFLPRIISRKLSY
jgi:hypothetical protein